MNAIVSIRANSRNKYPFIQQFEKDIGIKIHLYKVRTSQTKGKVESANRFIQWLEPYNGELKREDELIELINKIEHDVNNKTNRITGIPPEKLIKKEMEYLKPLPNKLLMSYIFSNGITEGTNNLIKVIKCIAFGYRSFVSFKIRIFLITNTLVRFHNKRRGTFLNYLPNSVFVDGL